MKTINCVPGEHKEYSFSISNDKSIARLKIESYSYKTITNNVTPFKDSTIKDMMRFNKLVISQDKEGPVVYVLPFDNDYSGWLSSEDTSILFTKKGLV